MNKQKIFYHYIDVVAVYADAVVDRLDEDVTDVVGKDNKAGWVFTDDVGWELKAAWVTVVEFGWVVKTVVKVAGCVTGSKLIAMLLLFIWYPLL